MFRVTFPDLIATAQVGDIKNGVDLAGPKTIPVGIIH